MNSMERQKDMTLKDELPRSVGAQYATGDQWRNNSRKNEGVETKQKKKKNKKQQTAWVVNGFLLFICLFILLALLQGMLNVVRWRRDWQTTSVFLP